MAVFRALKGQMSKIIISPTPEILEIADLLQIGVARFLEATSALPPLGKFESDIEALNLFSLVVRNLEGLAALAKTDLVLYPSAQVLARAIFEISVKAMWLLSPEDLMEREVRWLAHVAEEERVLQRLAKRCSEHESIAKALNKNCEELKAFRIAVSHKLPEGYKELCGNPSMEQMLQDLHREHLYSMYIMLAQFVHGGHAATRLYRKNLGINKRSGEYIYARDWYVPLNIATMTLGVSARFLLERIGLSGAEVLDFSLRRRIRIALNKIDNQEQK